MLLYRLVTPLPTRTKDDHVIIFSKLMNTNVDCFDPLVLLRVFDMIVWMCLWSTGTNPGFVVLMDMSTLTFGHLVKFNLVHLKKYMFYIQVLTSFIERNL